jgi:hypothetical protein
MEMTTMTELGALAAMMIAWFIATGATASTLAWTGHPWFAVAALAIGGCMTVRYKSTDDKTRKNGDSNA